LIKTTLSMNLSKKLFEMWNLLLKYGHTSERVEVPAELTRNETNDKIRKAFEGCRVSWIWYMHSYKISWKPT
jgi:hypothetical protein